MDGPTPVEHGPGQLGSAFVEQPKVVQARQQPWVPLSDQLHALEGQEAQFDRLVGSALGVRFPRGLAQLVPTAVPRRGAP